MIKVPTISEYKKHLKKYAQYAQSSDWVDWCASIAELRAKRIITLLRKYKSKDSKVLDLGCGIGLTISLLAQEYKNTIGCDIGDKSVKATKELLSKVALKNKVVKYDGRKLPFKPHSFDVVLSLEVIEHASEPEVMLEQIHKSLKKNGILIITTANKWWPIEPHFKLLFLSYLPTFLADSYVRLAKKGNSYENIKLPHYSEFRKMVEKYFTVEDVTIKIIRDYQDFGLDRERGFKVVVVGEFLKIINKFNDTPFSFISDFVNWVLLRVSLGWVFVATPKK